MSTQMLNEQTFTPAQLREMPLADRGMNVPSTALKAVILLGITAVFFTVGWNNTRSVIAATSGPAWILGYMLLVALTIVAAGNPRLALPLALAYAVAQGMWMGAISRIYEYLYDGVVAQTLLATIGTFLACLVLYSTRTVRVTQRFGLVLTAALSGMILLYLFGLLFSLSGVDLVFWQQPTPLGIGLSVVASLLAAMSLLADFAFVESGVEAGAPATMEWYAAFGLLSSLVWLYLQILQLLTLLRSRDR